MQRYRHTVMDNIWLLFGKRPLAEGHCHAEVWALNGQW